MKDIRSRYFEIILYKDYPNYEDFLSTLNNNYSIVYILHDKDTNEDGELLKPHYHVLFIFENARYKSAFQKELDYFDNLISPITNYKKFMLYMIHFKDPHKYNYNREDMKGSQYYLDILYNLLDKERGETNEITIILDYIHDSNWIITQEEIFELVLNNNIWSTFRRNFSIIKSYINNHNIKIGDLKKYNEKKELLQ